MIIESVEIKGFWGNKTAFARINQDVTIFIGLNGTGKTTYVNLIAAVLSADLIQLSSLKFQEITIKLKDVKDKKIRTIKVTNCSESAELPSSFNLYEYKIGKGTKIYPLITEVRNVRTGMSSSSGSVYHQPRYRDLRDLEVYFELKQELANIVEVSQISAYRHSHNLVSEEYIDQRTSAVDEKLKQLFERFSRYQLKLETRLNEISKEFQQKAVSLLIYDQKMDSFDIKNFPSEQDLQYQNEKLYRAFIELGIGGNFQENIKQHINKIKIAIEFLKRLNERTIEELKAEVIQKTDIILMMPETETFLFVPNLEEMVDAFLVLPLIYRTSQIIDLLNESEEEKKRTIEPREKFFEILEDFMPNKKFRYDNKTSEFTFYPEKNQKEELPWIYLSSGEKQLLIQFLEVLLQENRTVIFIADEPELSLHVTWQEKLLKSIRSLNNNAQVIVATHSPDIVADFRDNVIDMEDVIIDTKNIIN